MIIEPRTIRPQLNLLLDLATDAQAAGWRYSEERKEWVAPQRDLVEVNHELHKTIKAKNDLIAGQARQIQGLEAELENARSLNQDLIAQADQLGRANDDWQKMCAEHRDQLNILVNRWGKLRRTMEKLEDDNGES